MEQWLFNQKGDFKFYSLNTNKISDQLWITSLSRPGPGFLLFFPCEIDDAIQYINHRYGAQASKIVIL